MSGSFRRDQLTETYAIGFGILVLLLFLLALARKESGAKVGIFLATLWLAIWSCELIAFKQAALGQDQYYKQLLQIYNSQQYEVAEGNVHVIQRAVVREHGDIINVGGVEFEIGRYSFPYGSYAYRDTITENGVLREGVYARIYYVDEAIIRIDIKNSN